MTQRQAPDCGSCRHYYVTWEPRNPKGCRAFGFKSRDLPSRVVLQESGRPCTLYEARPAPPGAAPRGPGPGPDTRGA